MFANAWTGARLKLSEWQSPCGDEKAAVPSPLAAFPLSRATCDCSRYRCGNSPFGWVACSAVSCCGSEGRTARLGDLIP
jgi:hypothetical protein